MFYQISNWVIGIISLFLLVGIYNERRGGFLLGSWSALAVMFIPNIVKSKCIFAALIPLYVGLGFGLYQHEWPPILYGLGWCVPFTGAWSMVLGLHAKW